MRQGTISVGSKIETSANARSRAVDAMQQERCAVVAVPGGKALVSMGDTVTNAERFSDVAVPRDEVTHVVRVVILRLFKTLASRA